MRGSIMEDQDEFIIRNSGREEVGSEANNRAALEDIGMVALQSKITCGLFQQSFLILVKLTVSSKFLLKSKLNKS